MGLTYYLIIIYFDLEINSLVLLFINLSSLYSSTNLLTGLLLGHFSKDPKLSEGAIETMS